MTGGGVPAYEVVYGFFSLPDNPHAQAGAFSDYEGARICRPEGWAIADLEPQGLTEDFVTYRHPKDPAGCADMILEGDADVYSIELETAASSFAKIGARDAYYQNPKLSLIGSLHFATHKTNPRGQVYLAMLHSGLTEMRETGEWYDIIATSLAEFSNLEP
jgi:hypothetical protein